MIIDTPDFYIESIQRSKVRKPVTYDRRVAMKRLEILASVAFCVTSATAFSAEWKPPTAEVPKDDAAYIAKAKTAAPPSVVNNATIVRRRPKG